MKYEGPPARGGLHATSRAAGQAAQRAKLESKYWIFETDRRLSK
jgi:hypothetical protein